MKFVSPHAIFGRPEEPRFTADQSRTPLEAGLAGQGRVTAGETGCLEECRRWCGCAQVTRSDADVLDGFRQDRDCAKVLASVTRDHIVQELRRAVQLLAVFLVHHLIGPSGLAFELVESRLRYVWSRDIP